MKYLINVLSFLILAPFCFPIQDANAASPGELKTTGVYLNEISVGSGYAWGTLKSYSGNLALYPGFLRIGFNMNSVAGIEGARSQLQLALEPFINSIAEPTADVETGMSIGLRYLHKLSAPLYLFTEASFAPMFLSIKSTEQGAAGFNFLDQGGVVSTPEYSVPPLPEHSVPVIPEQYVPPVPEQSVPPRQVGFVTS